jgi:hypothetical protein
MAFLARDASPAAFREAPASAGGFGYTERHLQCVWFDARWRPPLTTIEGEPVAVLSPGRWNLEAGPDFLDAVLEIGRDRRRTAGDVEIHVHPGDWRQHGHAADARYASLAAHVTYFAPNGPLPGIPPHVVRIALGEALRAQPSFSFDLVDLTAYPYSTLPAELPPCALRLAAWPRAERERLLVCAAHERLRLKAARIARRMAEAGPAQTFYEETLIALGYKHNRAGFLTLARRVPAAELAAASGGDALRAYAMLLGVAGLLPGDLPGETDGETRAFVRAVWDAWWRMPSAWHERAHPPIEWHTAGLRPHNHPRRRLAAAAALFADSPRLCDAILALPTGAPDWPARAADLFDRAERFPYWPHRLALGAPPTARPVALAGAGRLAAVTANVLAPFLAAAGRAAAGLAEHLPASDDNALTRETANLLFGRDHNPALLRRGLLQQGLLQIFHDHCLNRRPGCEGCRLAEALAATAGTPLH